MMDDMITGSIVALVTPMLEGSGDEPEVDWDSLYKLIDWHIESETSAIVSVGTTGESATLDCAEHVEVIKRTVAHAAGRIPIIAGTGANSTKEALVLTKAAKEVGADAVLLVTPYYNKPTQEGLYQHHKLIAERVDIPQILYNVPGRTACDMLPDTVIRLAKIENIVGVKEATGELNRVKAIKAGTPDNFAIYSGDDASATEAMLMGAQGDISVVANVLPKEMAELCRLAIAGEVEAARALDARLMGLHKQLFIESNPIPVKWALQQLGRIGPAIRLPLLPLSDQSQESVRQAMISAGAL